MNPELSWNGGTAPPGSSDRRQLKELSTLGSGSFAGLAHLQKALKEQERFCRGLASHQLPPPLLDIPWLPSHSGGKKPRQQGGGGSSRLGVAVSARQLAEAGQPAGEAADGSAAGAAGLAAHNVAMAQHERDVYQLLSQTGPGPLATQQQQPQQGLAPAPVVAGISAARLMLVPDIRPRLPLTHPPFQMYVFADGDIVSGQIAQEGSWEQHEAQQLVGKLEEVAQARGLKQQELIFIDIGANIGAHSMVVAASGFAVLAFEPLHVNIMSLRHTLCANPALLPRVALIPKGLGNRTEACTIYTAAHNQGDGTMLCGVADSPEGYPGLAARGRLQVARLDELLQPKLMRLLAGKVGVVKIDVEGNEERVVEGGLRFFQTVRPPYIMAECSDDMMVKATGKPASAFLLKMSGLGYEVRQHSFEGPVLDPAQLADWPEPSINNYWFILR
ncbi:hypothetical protein N2152v2_003649 [Parachlorella kessleri]